MVARASPELKRQVAEKFADVLAWPWNVLSRSRHTPLIPAQAGTQFFLALRPRFRGDERRESCASIQERRNL